MDEPIVSIYDMLVERHEKKKKINRVKEPRPTVRRWSQPEVTGKDAKKQTESKPSKGKLGNKNTSHPVSEQQQLIDRRLANVVKASNLIQKPGNSVIIPVPTKKEILNPLVEKMSSKVRNVQSKVVKPDILAVKQSASSKTLIIKKPKQSKANPDSRSARSNKQKRSKRSSLPSSGKKNMTTQKKEDNNQKPKKQPVAAPKPSTARPKLKVRTPVSGSRKASLLAHKSKMSLKEKSGVHLAIPGGASRWRV